MSTTAVWFYGCLGGLLPVIIKIARSGDDATQPAYFTHWWFYLSAVALAFLGGLAASLLNLQDASDLTGLSVKLTAIGVGYSGADILSKLFAGVGAKVAPPTGVKAARRRDVYQFLRS